MVDEHIGQNLDRGLPAVVALPLEQVQQGLHIVVANERCILGELSHEERHIPDALVFPVCIIRFDLVQHLPKHEGGELEVAILCKDLLQFGHVLRKFFFGVDEGDHFVHLLGVVIVGELSEGHCLMEKGVDGCSEGMVFLGFLKALETVEARCEEGTQEGLLNALFIPQVLDAVFLGCDF